MPNLLKRKYLPAGFAIGGCIIFLSLVSVAIFQQQSNTLQIRALIEDTRNILGDANELNFLIRDAERGQRGYLLSGKAEYLEPYDAALKGLPAVFERLQQRSAGDPIRRQSFADLESLIRAKLAELAQTIQVRTDSGEEPARQILLNGTGKSLMFGITAKLDSIVGDESRRLTERTATGERDAAKMRLMIALGSGMTVLLLSVAALTLRQLGERRRQIERNKEQRRHSELERSQADLREMTLRNDALQYARSLLEASLDPMIAISAEGKITDVNEATVKVTGTLRELLIGTDFSDYFTEPEKARDGYKKVFATGSVTDYPLTIRHRNQDLTEVLYNASVYMDGGDNVRGVFAAARDVSAQKRAEAEIAGQRAKELERLDELERFQAITVGRELKMIELKKEIAELRKVLV
jgi:PAS domain S-box-containing protein